MAATGGTIILLSLSLALLMSLPAAQQVIGTAYIHAPAVLITNNTGTLTNISVTVTRGTGKVTIIGPQIIANSTEQSAQTAAYYAAKYLGLNASRYNFTYSILDAGSNVSGPSAGAAMAIMAISALSGKQLLHDFTMTGTISPSGAIGQIGGVYDKTSAAKAEGISFIIVPGAAGDPAEEQLYLLVQGTFGIPLVQVSNISSASVFAFGIMNPQDSRTSYNIYQNISPNRIPAAPFTCSNGCNTTVFQSLMKYTFEITNSTIASIGAPGLSGVAAQMRIAMSQYSVLAAEGYLYGASNLAFQVYVDSYYFHNYRTNLTAAIEQTASVQSYCNSLAIPQLTSSNYEYVISGELRQTWGAYTANAVLSGLSNDTQLTTDGILGLLGQTGEASGWCHAANELYNLPGASGQSVAPSASLSSVASARLQRAAFYGSNIYYMTALQANTVRNYPLAILDADYAYAVSYASSQATQPTSTLLNMSASLAANSTYGAWPTQFANEAYFYIKESGISPNSTAAHDYAVSAYSAALLAHELSNDTRIINASLSLGVYTSQIGGSSAQSQSNTSNYQLQATLFNLVGSIQQLVSYIYIISILNLILITALVIAVFALLHALLKLIGPTNEHARLYDGQLVKNRKRSAKNKYQK
jgi:hypothetical protein